MRFIPTRARWLLAGVIIVLFFSAAIYAQEIFTVQRGYAWVRGGITLLGTTGNSIIAEGATADAFETELLFGDPIADISLTLPAGTTGAFVLSSLTTNGINIVNSIWGASNALVFEGATADAFELSLAPADVAADVTVTIPDMGVASALLGSTLTTNTTGG